MRTCPIVQLRPHFKSHNSMQFLKQEDGQDQVSFITSSEQTGFLHLYHYSLRLNQENFAEYSDGVLKTVSCQSKQLTDGDWSLMHDETVSVDEKNHLIYFTAYRDPLESHL